MLTIRQYRILQFFCCASAVVSYQTSIAAYILGLCVGLFCQIKADTVLKEQLKRNPSFVESAEYSFAGIFVGTFILMLISLIRLA